MAAHSKTIATLSGRLASRNLSTRAPSAFLGARTPIYYYSTASKDRGDPSVNHIRIPRLDSVHFASAWGIWRIDLP